MTSPHEIVVLAGLNAIPAVRISAAILRRITGNDRSGMTHIQSAPLLRSNISSTQLKSGLPNSATLA